VNDFIAAFYAYFKESLPRDPRSEPLPDKVDEEDLQHATTLQLEEYERRSSEAARAVAFERKRREATGGVEAKPTSGYGGDNEMSVSTYNSNLDWLNNDELSQLLGLKALFSNGTAEVSLTNFATISGCFAPFSGDALYRVCRCQSGACVRVCVCARVMRAPSLSYSFLFWPIIIDCRCVARTMVPWFPFTR
jgi:hypothetical protein